MYVFVHLDVFSAFFVCIQEEGIGSHKFAEIDCFSLHVVLGTDPRAFLDYVGQVFSNRATPSHREGSGSPGVIVQLCPKPQSRKPNRY